jgi:hypothetical protein
MQRRGLVNLVLAGSACGIRPLAPPPRYRQGLRGLLPRNNALLGMLALGGVWPAVACHRTGSPLVFHSTKHQKPTCGMLNLTVDSRAATEYCGMHHH